MPNTYTKDDVSTATENMLGLRDNAMFDKLRHVHGIVPKNQKEAQDLLELADQEEARAEAGLPAEGPSRFGGLVKQGHDDLRSRGVVSDEDERVAILNLADKVAADQPDLLESALCVAFAAGDDEEGQG